MIQSILLDELQDGKIISTTSELYFFSEEKYINKNPKNFDVVSLNLLRNSPILKEIAGFIEAIYDLALIAPE